MAFFIGHTKIFHETAAGWKSTGILILWLKKNWENTVLYYLGAFRNIFLFKFFGL